MNKNDFWVTCPQCQRKFGVSQQIVIKYFDRVLKDTTQELTERAQRVFKQKQVPPPENLPT